MISIDEILSALPYLSAEERLQLRQELEAETSTTTIKRTPEEIAHRSKQLDDTFDGFWGELLPKEIQDIVETLNEKHIITDDDPFSWLNKHT